MSVNRLNDIDALEVIVAIIALPFGLVLFVIPLLLVIAIVVFGLVGAIKLKLRQWRSKPATQDELREILKGWGERKR